MSINFKLIATARVAALLFLGGSVGLAVAQDVDIAQSPMAVKSKAKPTFIFALDDSGSMDSEVLLPTNDGAAWFNTEDNSFIGRNSADAAAPGVINFNKAGGANSTWKKYVYLFPNGVSGSDGRRTYGDSTNDHYAIPPTKEFAWLRSHVYNPIFYDPTQTYTPWEPAYNDSSLIKYSNISISGNVAAPTHPGQSTTNNTTELISTIDSSATGFRFKIQEGMVWDITGATCYDTGSTTVRTCNSPASEVYDAKIPYYPATYYISDSTCTNVSCPAVGPDGVRLRKIVINSSTSSYWCGSSCTRTYAQEIQNFANWFSYYRKRRLLLNAAFGQALNDISKLRVGRFRFSESPSSVSIFDFDTTYDKEKFLYGIYNMDTTGGTPTRKALDRIGTLFDTQTGAQAPILNACQYNAGFILTDGFANTTLPSNRPDNADGAAGTFSGAAPYADTFSNTLADYAMFFYTKRLRSDLPAGQVPVNSYDASPSADKNPDLHLNTYALTMGAKGTIYGVDVQSSVDPYKYPPVWPKPDTDRNPTAVDDLFHATINGRGDMFSATNVAELSAGIKEAINRVFAKSGAAAAGAVQNPNVTSDQNDYFESTYNSGNWTGELKARNLDATTGDISANTVWESQALLDARTSSSRFIATYTGAAGVAFTSTALSASLSEFASPTSPPGPSDGAAVINYLRGDRSGESAYIYRNRAHLLGDIVNGEPVIVRAPFRNYADAGYSTFKKSNAVTSRVRVVLQGANDGMLHAFNANTGAEEWAYIPKMVLPNLKYLTQRINFQHRYFVDSTPVYEDVDFKSVPGTTGGGTDWRTIAVSGLGAGGKGYFALDLTETTATNEADLVGKVLWEFPNNATATGNVGFSFGKPVITKLGNGDWVVLVTSGYNNAGSGDGVGHLYLLNPMTGAIVKDIPTGVGSTTTPSGLGPVAVYAENGDVDNTALAAYAGDLQGNLWHFNLDTEVVTKIATLVDANNIPQPITAVPELASFTVGGVMRHALFVGTGKYIGDTDVPSTAGANTNASQTQTAYVLLVDPASPVQISPLRSKLEQQSITASGNVLTTTAVSVNLCGDEAKLGWYADLPVSGQRLVTDMAIAQKKALMTINLPSSDVCSPGGQSWYLEMGYSPSVNGCNVAIQSSIDYIGNVLASRVVIAQLASGQQIGLIRKSDTTTEKRNIGAISAGSGTKRISWRELIAR